MAKKKDRFENVPLKDQIKPVFEKRFREMLKTDENYKKFIETILTPQRKSFRINKLKEKNPEKAIKILKEKGLILNPVNWSKNAYFAEFSEEVRTDLGNLYEHFLGKIYVQEATSMCPPELLEIPKEIDDDFKVLDMAASPGSKTTQLGDMMQNKGTLVANEIDFKRLGPLKINLERSGLTNVIISNLDGRNVEGEEIFDRILLDAPCSGSGVIRKSPKTIKTYNPKKLRGMQHLQLQLMQRAYHLLKKGGIMTYSTCSIDPEENEFAIQKFLEQNPEAILENAKLKGLILNNKLEEFDGKKIPKEITQKTIRIWPQDNDTNGFYVAKISKPKL
ncbi:MAG: RsmB/NOP family class I SAM-dependent RNA methyltransferase [Candidatus Woesearchaeota archaeon]|jgi:NOL1/NOP2/sun family putative RNA methylase|nr:RsmB/NOP family class I SAM-dependent RNA methyltransferase [Candidatus Woesearchaeota archaeon]